jgi:signal transduction histidine kinase/CheY-like chemotaxis protein
LLAIFLLWTSHLQALIRLIKVPYALALVRIAGHYGLALTAFLVPEVGENRMIVAGLLAFVIGPAIFLFSLKFNSFDSPRIDPFIDLFTLLVIVSFVPEVWHPALLIGVVVAQSPSVTIGAGGHRFYSASSALLILGMSSIAVFRDVENWHLPILVLVAVYPAVVLYSFLQTRRIEEIREKAEALSALQLLAGGVAHDFNNILTGISGYAEFAKSSGYEPHATGQALDKIIDSSKRAGLLTQQLMSFAGDSKVQMLRVDVGHEVRAVADMLRATLEPGIRIEVDAPQLPIVALGDPARLHQVIMNLMVNAVEASRNPGVVRVKVDKVEDQIQIEVADDGEGIPSSVQSNMFQPFVTSKPTGHGLGLAVVKNIVDEHGGSIDVVSNVGVGTRFIVRLPCGDSEALEEIEDKPQANTILIADDETPIRVILRQVLEMDGFEVVEAEDGNRFLELFECHKSDICAIVLDVKMPGRTGWQCLDEVRQVAPELPALIISGYDPEGPTIERPDHAMRFLAKPFRIAEVKKAIHELRNRGLAQHPRVHSVSS